MGLYVSLYQIRSKVWLKVGNRQNVCKSNLLNVHSNSTARACPARKINYTIHFITSPPPFMRYSTSKYSVT